MNKFQLIIRSLALNVRQYEFKLEGLVPDEITLEQISVIAFGIETAVNQGFPQVRVIANIEPVEEKKG